MSLPEMTDKELRAIENRPFTPFHYMDKDGDCIEFIMSPHPYYGKRLDDLMTVYLSTEDDSVAGFLIKKVSKIVSEPVLKTYQLSAGKIPVSILLSSYFSTHKQAFTTNEGLVQKLFDRTVETASN